MPFSLPLLVSNSSNVQIEGDLLRCEKKEYVLIKNCFLIYPCYRIVLFTKEKWVEVQLGHTIWFYSIMYDVMASFYTSLQRLILKTHIEHKWKLYNSY